MNTTEEYVWAIAHIDKSLIDSIDKDISKHKQYSSLDYAVPAIKILTKQFKGKSHFDKVPLLFYYGFFKVPLLWALNDDLLDKIRKDIGAISTWVRDRAKAHSTKAKYSFDEDGNYIKKYLTYKDVSCATVTEVEVMRLIKFAAEESIHSAEDINKLKVGDTVTLMGYPFEGIEAEILSINPKKKELNVKLKVDEGMLTNMMNTNVAVHFDSVFWSIYRGSYAEEYNQERIVKSYQTAKNPEENEG